MFRYADELLAPLENVYLSHGYDGDNAGRQHQAPFNDLLRHLEMNENSDIAYHEQVNHREGHQTWLRCRQDKIAVVYDEVVQKYARDKHNGDYHQTNNSPQHRLPVTILLNFQDLFYLPIYFTPIYEFVRVLCFMFYNWLFTDLFYLIFINL